MEQKTNQSNGKVNIHDIVAKIRKEDRKPRILIIGMGSVAGYLLEYLAQDNVCEVHVATRNIKKAESTINCITLASLIRTKARMKVQLHQVDIESTSMLDNMMNLVKPDIVVNTSRFLAHVKYGSISWTNCRAYGYWIPMSMYFTKKIGESIMRTNTDAIFINTSYPDATNGWLVGGCGFNRPILGAGNVNHIMARYKSAFVAIWNNNHGYKLNEEDINVLIEAGHFHDVLIGKEGTDTDSQYVQPIGKQILVKVELTNPWDEKLQKSIDEFAKANHFEILSKCNVPFPSDASRNMMVASSVFEIIDTICMALSYPVITDYKKQEPITQFVNIPGAFGNIGGNPIVFILNDNAKAFINKASIFGVTDDYARRIKIHSLYEDGLDASEIHNGYIKFVNKDKLNKLEALLDFQYPERLHYNEVEDFAQRLVQYVQIYLTNK